MKFFFVFLMRGGGFVYARTRRTRGASKRVCTYTNGRTALVRGVKVLSSPGRRGVDFIFIQSRCLTASVSRCLSRLDRGWCA